MIAIPDFGPGAMENWGLVTFRMTTILYNPKETSSESKEHVATVIAHELAHQVRKCHSLTTCTNYYVNH